MPYWVHSIFYTLQGEGAWSGRPAVFVRFAGCNLWSGLEKGRTSALCSFCDTDFISPGGAYAGYYASAQQLVARVESLWPDLGNCRYVVCTGGEPALQLDEGLVEALQMRGFKVAVETNGTCALPKGVDWVCVSPKPGTNLLITRGDELKLIYPVSGLEPCDYEQMEFRLFYLQPLDDSGGRSVAETRVGRAGEKNLGNLGSLGKMDDLSNSVGEGAKADNEANLRAALEYCLRYPRWSLSLQIHKWLGID